MHDETETEEPLQLMWATVQSIDPSLGITAVLDNGEEVTVLKSWVSFWGHDAESMNVGTRLRCAVQVKWTPTYFVQDIVTAVHEGGRT